MLPRAVRLEDGVRLVPGGASVRDGTYLGRGVVIMPPSFVNVGAYVDDGTLIDSNALVGSCAQVGKRVHLSAGAQIGGVLEPAGALPVVIEDDVLIGGNCGIYEGCWVRKRAVLGSGVVLNASSKLFDLVHARVFQASDSARWWCQRAPSWCPGRGVSRGLLPRRTACPSARRSS